VNERRVSEGSVLDTLPCDETTGWPIDHLSRVWLSEGRSGPMCVLSSRASA